MEAFIIFNQSKRPSTERIETKKPTRKTSAFFIIPPLLMNPPEHIQGDRPK